MSNSTGFLLFSWWAMATGRLGWGLAAVIVAIGYIFSERITSPQPASNNP